MEEIATIKFSDVDEFVDNVINHTFSDYNSVTIVCNGSFAVKLLSSLFMLEDTFYPEDIEVKSGNYDLYYVDVMDNGAIFCEPVFKNGKAVLSDSSLTYIQNIVSKGMYQYFGDGPKSIFMIRS